LSFSLDDPAIAEALGLAGMNTAGRPFESPTSRAGDLLAQFAPGVYPELVGYKSEIEETTLPELARRFELRREQPPEDLARVITLKQGPASKLLELRFDPFIPGDYLGTDPIELGCRMYYPSRPAKNAPIEHWLQYFTAREAIHNLQRHPEIVDRYLPRYKFEIPFGKPLIYCSSEHVWTCALLLRVVLPRGEGPYLPPGLPERVKQAIWKLWLTD
jgi:hypothetical protein